MSRDLNDTLMFVKVVEHGSFTAASRALGVPKATLSRKLQDLERRLGTTLLKRTTRRLGLTEPGQLYYEHSARIVRDLDEAEQAVTQHNGAPRGWLRFTAPYALGSDSIAPLLPEFMTRYPDLRVEANLTNDRIDLISSEMDVAIRVGALEDSTLSARKLTEIRTSVYASPEYLARHGEPLAPDDLRHHRTIVSSKQRFGSRWSWALTDGRERVEIDVAPVMIVNDPPSMLHALVAGVGVALAADPFGAVGVAGGQLRVILPSWRGPTYELNAVFPPGRMHSPKVRVFVEFLIERLNIHATAQRTLFAATAVSEVLARVAEEG